MTRKMILSSLAAVTALAAVGCGGRDAGEPAYAPQYQYAPTDAAGDAPATEYDGADDMAPAPPPAPAPTAAGGMAEQRMPRAQPKSRPGLATSWGETRHSRVSTAPFVRANSSSPFAIGKLFYNDPDGIAAMSDSQPGWRQNVRRFAIGSGHLEIGLKDGSGNFLTGFRAGGDNYVTGIAGRRYSIVVKNHSPGRVEVVVSVDGLDVIDGKPASVKNRGYLIDAFGDLEIEGFRTSNTEVAAFRFGSVSQSYANKKHGKTRNVGVIGVAVFHERGDNPKFWGSPHEAKTRQGANPFPQTYASPP